MVQKIIVAMIGIATAAYIVAKIIRVASGKDNMCDCGCGCGKNCKSKRKDCNKQ